MMQARAQPRIKRWLVAAIAVGVTACGDDGVTPPPMQVYTEVSASAYHTCALTEDGTAWCWGLASAGELGNGGYDLKWAATPVHGERRYSTISTGRRHTCALEEGGQAWCWGYGEFGQLGTNSPVQQAMPVPVLSDSLYTDIAAGWLHTCAVTEEGSVHCWGRNDQGQLGDGTTELRDSAVVTLGPEGVHFASIDAGLHHTCALDDSGAAWCWGLNSQGELGNGTTVNSLVPVPVAGGRRFQQISVGRDHTCGIALDGIAFCWGGNEIGQLAITGNTDPGWPGSTTPRQVHNAFRYASIDAGDYFTCAASTSRVLICWGRGWEGQLGTGQLRSWPVPVPAHQGPPFVQVSAGGRHGCGVTDVGSIWCWGSGEHGQLGIAATKLSAVPVRILER